MNTVACLNCGTPLVGPFCAECGQRDLPPEPSLRELIAEAWDAFVSVDGKVAGTLRLLLVRPGGLTAAYLEGKRARFLPPLRMYLLCTVVFFLVQAAKPDHPTPARIAAQARVDSQTVARHADSATMARRIDSVNAMPHNRLWKRMKINGLRVANDGKNFMGDFRAQTPRMLFITMPIFAALLMLVYRARRRSYATHLIVSLHLHAFVFAGLTVALLLAWALPDALQRVAAFPLALWLVSYTPLALRRVYGGGLVGATARTTLLIGIYAVVVLAAIAALAVGLVFLY